MATDPTGRPTSLDLLRAVTACDPAHQSAWERIITALTDELGTEQSVWGVKLHEGRISYELYFCTRLPYPNEVLQPILDAAATGFARVGTWTAPRELPPYSGQVSFEFAIDPDGGIHGPDDLDV